MADLPADAAPAVSLRISPAILHWMFRLPEATTLEAASVEDDGGHPVLVLTVCLPDTPPDAARVDITYTRRTDIPDPMQVTGYRWFREDGSEIGALMSGNGDAAR